MHFGPHTRRLRRRPHSPSLVRVDDNSVRVDEKSENSVRVNETSEKSAPCQCALTHVCVCAALLKHHPDNQAAFLEAKGLSEIGIVLLNEDSYVSRVCVCVCL